ncbi:MAG: aldehyde ferredoxin oxidoreductase [Bacteroidetes bacterium]|nr:aldehyde ferredoxin oxidoreductase [Bacteroidota bacterium]
MEPFQKVMMIDATKGYYRIEKFRVGNFFGPVDLGYYLAGNFNSLNIGTGLLAGSIFPGSNRLIVNGFSPSWGGFYISSMGGASLEFDNLGLNMLCITGKAPVPSVLYLNRVHGEEIELISEPVDLREVWSSGRKGFFAMMDYVYERFKGRYETPPRVLATGPAAIYTDIGAIGSAAVRDGELSHAETWAGRGGFGTKMLRDHGIASIIYGGTYIDQDFTDRKVANEWFEHKYKKKLAAKAIEATTKYRFDPNFNTGGTLGVNYASVGGKLLFNNYRSIYLSEEDRKEVHQKFILDHYLKQFNEETIQKKQQVSCGEPCAAVCKKMNGKFKKDFEPYQVMGPLTGIFDQRAAEKLNHHADMLGLDAISAGGALAWLMECLYEGHLTEKELQMQGIPAFNHENFSLIYDSQKNAEIGIQLLDNIVRKDPPIDFSDGARRFARRLSREKNKNIIDCFVFNAYARKGWMVPNQYWTPGVLSPMSMMGKYYMYYGNEFLEPRELGRTNAERMKQELIIDNMGFCRFHRNWAEEMIPEIVESLYGKKEEYLQSISITASRIHGRNSSQFWESERNIDFMKTFIARKIAIDDNNGPVIKKWNKLFHDDKTSAALDYWYEIHKGAHESLREF